jgi:hypothetical protein
MILLHSFQFERDLLIEPEFGPGNLTLGQVKWHVLAVIQFTVTLNAQFHYRYFVFYTTKQLIDHTTTIRQSTPHIIMQMEAFITHGQEVSLS